MHAFTLTTIGTGTALPDAVRGSTAQLIHYGEATIAVDLGSGALQKLAQAGVTAFTLDALVFTHAHIDHIADVMSLLFALSVLHQERSKPLDIYASSQTLHYLHGLETLFGAWLTAPASNVRWHTIAPHESYAVAGLTLETGTVQHTESSVALRFRAPDGRLLAIPGDTAPHPPLHDFVRGADLLVIECGNPSGVENAVHLSPQSLRTLLADTQPACTVVTHRPLELSPEVICEEVLRAYHGSLFVAADMETFVVG